MDFEEIADYGLLFEVALEEYTGPMTFNRQQALERLILAVRDEVPAAAVGRVLAGDLMVLLSEWIKVLEAREQEEAYRAMARALSQGGTLQ